MVRESFPFLVVTEQSEGAHKKGKDWYLLYCTEYILIVHKQRITRKRFTIVNKKGNGENYFIFGKLSGTLPKFFSYQLITLNISLFFSSTLSNSFSNSKVFDFSTVI